MLETIFLWSYFVNFMNKPSYMLVFHEVIKIQTGNGVQAIVGLSEIL